MTKRAAGDARNNTAPRKAWTQMLLLVYGAVIVLCFITFRSWRAAIVAVVLIPALSHFLLPSGIRGRAAGAPEVEPAVA